jgi:hypothetical protein
MNNWISVKDRLPEEKEAVLVTDGTDMSVGCLYHKQFEPENVIPTYDMSCVEFDLGNITHWMPLPEPPEVENE